MRYVKVFLDRDETTKMDVDMPAWEALVFAAVNGHEHCKPMHYFSVDREMPSAQEEYDRLRAKYRDNSEASGQSWVSLVYGPGAVGIAKLEKVMAEHARIEGSGETDADVVVEPPTDDAEAELMADLGIGGTSDTADGDAAIEE